MHRIIMSFVFFVACIFSLNAVSYASGSSSAQMQSDSQSAPEKVTVSLYQQGLDATKANDWQKALPLFQQALAADPNNPDILNMLAHSQRELGNTDEAIANYKRALEIKPQFPEAREYLGEAYLQAAIEQVDTLKSYGAQGDEELDDLSHDIKDAAAKL